MLTTKEYSCLTINKSCDILEAMSKIKESARGLVVVIDDNHKAVGVVTDGDIRKVVVENQDIRQKLSSFMNVNFTSVEEGISRENILKLLDQKIRSVPVLDKEGKLVNLIDHNYKLKSKKRLARAKAPARISLAGGGTDYTKYFMDQGGAGLTCTIAKYSHAVLEKRDDQTIEIYSHDFREYEKAENISKLEYNGTLDLIKAGIKLMNPDFGFRLEIGCDFPPGSGLGGSAALLAALIGAFNEFNEEKLDRYTIAEYSFEAERLMLGISGGWQDQYSTVFGGFNYLQFNREHNVVTPLRLEKNTFNELQENLILCYSGKKHLGGQIQNVNQEVTETVRTQTRKRLKEVTDEMKRTLLKNDFKNFSRLLDETWQLKKKGNPDVTNPDLNEIYDTAIKAGATSGRLLGTGGGGYFLFFIPPFHRYKVIQDLQEKGYHTEPVIFDHEGATSWSSST
jgi:D-glycero-alpha-D-manno-heptose-7-phosphate kinase